MTPRLWSISALSVELCMDRRTVAHRLRNVPADGQLHGKPAWHLTTALDALRPRKSGPSEPDLSECPDYMRPIAAVKHPVHRGAVLMHCWTMTYAPVLAAWAVVEAGGSMSLAFETARNLPLMLAIETARIAREWQMEPWRSQEFPSIYAPHTFPEVDWQRLRDQAGEPGWRPPYPVPGFREGTILDAPPLSRREPSWR
jgi:hypothetical protein